MEYYKAFDKDLKCKGFQYEVGKEYQIEGELILCKNGFHFCKTIADCYEYYPKDSDTRICEVEPLGEIIEKETKCCTNKIRIVRELSEKEHLNGNVGLNNIGYCNEGYYNEGNCNEGYYNEGDYNKGYCNEGDYNIGVRNKGNCQVGVCNTNAPLVIFNKVSKMSLEDLKESGALQDITHGHLTDAVRKIDTFDIKVWNEIFGTNYEE